MYMAAHGEDSSVPGGSRERREMQAAQPRRSDQSLQCDCACIRNPYRWQASFLLLSPVAVSFTHPSCASVLPGPRPLQGQRPSHWCVDLPNRTVATLVPPPQPASDDPLRPVFPLCLIACAWPRERRTSQRGRNPFLLDFSCASFSPSSRRPIVGWRSL